MSLVPVGSHKARAPLRQGSLASPQRPSPSRFLRIGVLFSDERIRIEAYRIRGSGLGPGAGTEGGAPGRGGARQWVGGLPRAASPRALSWGPQAAHEDGREGPAAVRRDPRDPALRPCGSRSRLR